MAASQTELHTHLHAQAYTTKESKVSVVHSYRTVRERERGRLINWELSGTAGRQDLSLAPLQTPPASDTTHRPLGHEVTVSPDNSWRD